ncbi:hypothetical protein V1264_000658 [Littorina saxatilis]|uniref:Peptidoglycan-recognition protein n=2 Tax=Littorina saxatilis TaxID=31220 RepID=A0AAN9C578_9CAEN
MLVLLLFSLASVALGDQCTSHVLSSGTHAGAHGIGCVKSECCQFGLQLGDLCPGSDVCCFSSDTCSGGSQTGGGGCPHIISRSEWGARAPKQHIGNMAGPAQYVFIHHGSSPPCTTKSSCIGKVKSYQDYHLDGHGWSDIGYNFVVGEDGNAYMARGWTEIGAHTYGYNSVGIAICVIGDFNNRLPNDAALNTIKQLISCGLAGGYISSSYTLKGHRDVGSTDCPGTALYNLIHSWPHYKSGTQRYG